MAPRPKGAPVARVLPLMDLEGQFAGLGDALTGAVQWFEGRPDPSQVSALQAMLVAAHERLVEVAADHDREVMAAVVAGETPTADRLRLALRSAFLAGEVVPVLSGAALYNRGVDWLLDAVVAFVPGVEDLAARGLWAGGGRGIGPAKAVSLLNADHPILKHVDQAIDLTCQSC